MSAQPGSSTLLSFEDARHAVEKHASRLAPVSKEQLELSESYGRILAEPIKADRDFPPFRRAARDGYAVIADDLAQLPSTLRVIGEVKAGAAPASIPSVASGETTAIMTGAPAPDGTDAVVMVEYTLLDGDRVQITRGISAGDNIVPIGA